MLFLRDVLACVCTVAVIMHWKCHICARRVPSKMQMTCRVVYNVFEQFWAVAFKRGIKRGYSQCCFVVSCTMLAYLNFKHKTVASMTWCFCAAACFTFFQTLGNNTLLPEHCGSFKENHWLDIGWCIPQPMQQPPQMRNAMSSNTFLFGKKMSQ